MPLCVYRRRKVKVSFREGWRNLGSLLYHIFTHIFLVCYKKIVFLISLLSRRQNLKKFCRCRQKQNWLVQKGKRWAKNIKIKNFHLQYHDDKIINALCSAHTQVDIKLKRERFAIWNKTPGTAFFSPFLLFPTWYRKRWKNWVLSSITVDLFKNSWRHVARTYISLEIIMSNKC